MADDAAIRMTNFNRMWPADRFGPADLSRMLGNRPSFWSDLRAGRKSFGEKLARQIEDAGELVRGSLDDPQGAKRMAIEQDLLTHIQNLPEEQQRAVNALLRIHLGLPAPDNGEESGKQRRAG